MARIFPLKEKQSKEPSPIDLVVEKFSGRLKRANVIEIRDIFTIAAAYDSFYILENIENITVDKEDWITVTINGKVFQFQYFSRSWGGTYQFRVDGKNCKKQQVAEFLVGGFDSEMERFGHYRDLYKAIRDKNPNAFEMFKEAVKGMDWSYMMSDDNRWYQSGLWQEKALKDLAKLLSPEAEKHYQEEHNKYWNRVNSN